MPRIDLNNPVHIFLLFSWQLEKNLAVPWTNWLSWRKCNKILKHIISLGSGGPPLLSDILFLPTVFSPSAHGWWHCLLQASLQWVFSSIRACGSLIESYLQRNRMFFLQLWCEWYQSDGLPRKIASCYLQGPCFPDSLSLGHVCNWDSVRQPWHPLQRDVPLDTGSRRAWQRAAFPWGRVTTEDTLPVNALMKSQWPRTPASLTDEMVLITPILSLLSSPGQA